MKPYKLTGKALKIYRQGFSDGNESNYFPGGLDATYYDWGFRDGQKYGDRKGKPWTLTKTKPQPQLESKTKT
jgi:hypothetical protein